MPSVYELLGDVAPRLEEACSGPLEQIVPILHDTHRLLRDARGVMGDRRRSGSADRIPTWVDDTLRHIALSLSRAASLIATAPAEQGALRRAPHR